MSARGPEAVTEDLAPHLDALERAIAEAGPEEIRRLGEILGGLDKALDMRIAGVGREAVRKEIAEDDELLDVEDVAKIFKQKPGWIYAHQNELPFRVNTPGGVIKFSKKGVQNYIRRRQVGS
ncbi:MAG: helix-turn-helix domain-containing protein [Acidobacteriota bacterium]|nr:helix-turn-helix domain-containing protein [Acidobacteriota bacterium]